MNLQEALSNPIWIEHKIGDVYIMDRKPDLWKIVYYPIFEDGKTKEVYDEPRALVEKPIQGGIDFREIPLRYLTKIQPVTFKIVPYNNKPEYEKDVDLSKRVHWSYLHGQLENDCEYDCFGILDAEPDDLVEGIYLFNFKGKPCIFFYWYAQAMKTFKGLAVYMNDKQSYDYVEKCFLNKEECI